MEQEVVDQYLGYWAARFEANSGTPDPRDPSFEEYATGPQLEALRAETQSNLDEGRSFREASEPADYHQVAVISIEGDVAIVQACFVDDGVVVDRDNGAVLDERVGTQNVRGELHRGSDGRWRVAGVHLVQHWEGVAGCALAS